MDYSCQGTCKKLKNITPVERLSAYWACPAVNQRSRWHISGLIRSVRIASVWSSHFSQLFNCVTCDVIFAEHLLHANPEIHVLLSIFFKAFIVRGFLPNPLTDTVLVPKVKYKTKNTSDKGDYRPIALASVASKVFEMSLRVKLESFLHSSDYQFGFKANHSTDLFIYPLKEVIIDFYKSQSTSIYVCFMDAC